MWSRATRSYGRVLQRYSLGRALWEQEATAMKVQQPRTRRSTASVAAVAPIVPIPGATPAKRTRKAVSPTVKEEARAAESTSSSVQLRRSERVFIKTEFNVKLETVKTDQVTEPAIKPERKRDPGHAVGDEEDEDEKKSPKRRKKVVVKRGNDGKPENWGNVLAGIKEMRAAQIADVDVAGVEVMFDKGANPPHITRLYVLISAMLSSQTKDPVNAAAMKRLIAHGLTVQHMLDIDEHELALLIRPVGFYNNKARYIKQVAQILTERAAAAGSAIVDIPDTFEELVALPGVGPKMAHLVMSCAWNNTVGICVDTHVHRISNRLGWVNTWNMKNPKSQDPEKTRKELEDWLPREHWNPINVTLVGFGQTICHPRGPNCNDCKVNHLCPSAFSSVI